MYLALARVFFFFYPHGNCFYLNKRQHALLSSESVFEKLHAMFPWLSGESFGAKIICVIGQAEKTRNESKHIYPLSWPAEGGQILPLPTPSALSKLL